VRSAEERLRLALCVRDTSASQRRAEVGAACHTLQHVGRPCVHFVLAHLRVSNVQHLVYEVLDGERSGVKNAGAVLLVRDAHQGLAGTTVFPRHLPATDALQPNLVR